MQKDGSSRQTQLGERECTIEDFKSNFIKNPIVGESISFKIKKIFKKDAELIELVDGTKFKKSLSGDGIDYYYRIITEEDQTYDITSWEIFKKISAILKLVGKISGITIKITHIKDGLNTKFRGDNYKVENIS